MISQLIFIRKTSKPSRGRESEPPTESARGRTRKFFKIFSERLDHTANASNLIEKCFLDLRNIFSNQGTIRKLFSKQEDLSS